MVILEDMDKYNVKMGGDIKRWADHYPFPAASKFEGKRDIRPLSIIITSNYHPRDIWDDPQTYGPIMRRFKLVEYHAVQPDVEPDEPDILTIQRHLHMTPHDQYEDEVI